MRVIARFPEPPADPHRSDYPVVESADRIDRMSDDGVILAEDAAAAKD